MPNGYELNVIWNMSFDWSSRFSAFSLRGDDHPTDKLHLVFLL